MCYPALLLWQLGVGSRLPQKLWCHTQADLSLHPSCRPLPGSPDSGLGSSIKPSLLSRFGCTGGSGSGSSGAAGHPAGVLGLAVDLRQNCRDLREQLPADYLGNAAW